MPKLEKPLKASDFVGNEDRKQWIGQHPRIAYVGKKSIDPCDAGAGPLVGVGRATRYKRKCKLNAQFILKALPNSGAVSGHYCWTHLTDQLNHEAEKKSFNRWATKNPPPWQDAWEQFGEYLSETDAPEEPE